jgi:G6PDH family F420-dependent oxidoreductase
MVQVGYTLLCEQVSHPKQLVEAAVAAEEAGFDFAVISDHFFPWLDVQGHSAYAWSVLGAVAHATSRLGLMTYVTCPIRRYHPVVVAQKAATMGLLSDGRFTLGLGAGERLNEHVVGGGWPSVDVRHEMLSEAVQLIRRLFAGGYVTARGRHFQADSARIWDLPDEPVPIGVAASGPASCRLAGRLGDALIAVSPEASLVQRYREAGGREGSPVVGQTPLSYGPDPAEARRRAHEQFRWFAGGWKVMSELPGTAAFAAASASVSEEEVAEQIPCGPEVGAHVQAVRAYAEAGFTHVALAQVGGDTQLEFIDWAGRELLGELRQLTA